MPSEVISDALNKDGEKWKKMKLTIVTLAYIAAGASTPELMNPLRQEKEDLHLKNYQNNGGILPKFASITRIDGQLVVEGMMLTAEQYRRIDKAEQAKALVWEH